MNAASDDTARGRYKRPESVLVVVHCGAQVLLLKRADHPDFWQSVTGALEWDEAPRSAAIRELAEETGIRDTQGLLDLGRSNRFEILPQWRHRYAPGTTENLEHVFSLSLSQILPVALDPVEHSDFCWLPANQAARRVWSWSNRQAIEAAVAQ